MNEQLKKRLIGAVVLVALAVIFIPMLLDRGSESQVPTFGSNVPPKPETEFKSIDVPLQEPPAQPAEPQPINSERDAQEKAAEVGAAPSASADAGEAKAPEKVAAATSAGDPKPSDSAVSESKQTVAPTQEKNPTPVAAPKHDKPKTEAPPQHNPPKREGSTTTHAPAWAVQLGSFAQSANALSLRDRLRKKGFSAFVERQKSGGEVTYRVRVGPELKRENADLLKEKLAKAGFKGMVMPHP